HLVQSFTRDIRPTEEHTVGDKFMEVNMASSRETRTYRPRVVIVGAGFGGMNAAKALKHAPVDILMVDTNNFHTFQPLLYQVATAALDAGDVAHQVRSIVERQKNFRFRLGTVT